MLEFKQDITEDVFSECIWEKLNEADTTTKTKKALSAQRTHLVKAFRVLFEKHTDDLPLSVLALHREKKISLTHQLSLLREFTDADLTMFNPLFPPPPPPPDPSDPPAPSSPPKVFFVDGSCMALDGRRQAGIGVFAASPDGVKISVKVPKDLRQTNNTAEMYAILRTLETSRRRHIEIRSDSQCTLSLVSKIHKNTSYKGKSQNKSLLLKIATEMKMRKRKDLECKFVKVKAHSGDRGNEIADLLAKQAVDGKNRESEILFHERRLTVR